MSLISRRTALKAGALAAAGVLARPTFAEEDNKEEKSELPFKISVAEWSFHKAIFGKKMDHLDFAKTCKEEY